MQRRLAFITLVGVTLIIALVLSVVHNFAANLVLVDLIWPIGVVAAMMLSVRLLRVSAVLIAAISASIAVAVCSTSAFLAKPQLLSGLLIFPGILLLALNSASDAQLRNSK